MDKVRNTANGRIVRPLLSPRPKKLFHLSCQPQDLGGFAVIKNTITTAFSVYIFIPGKEAVK
jgi:hypothetical protein